MNWLDRVDWTDPIDRDCSLNSGLVGWFMGAPSLQGGNRLWNLCNKEHGTLTNMDPATDWVSTASGPAIAFNGGTEDVRETAGTYQDETWAGITLLICNDSTTLSTAFVNMMTVTSGASSTSISLGGANVLRNQVRVKFANRVGTDLSITGYGDVPSLFAMSYDKANITNVAISSSLGTVSSTNAQTATPQTLTGIYIGSRGADRYIVQTTTAAMVFKQGLSITTIEAIHNQWRAGWPDMLRRMRGRSLVSVPAAVGGVSVPKFFYHYQNQGAA